MNVTCPSCGAEMSLDVLLAHEESRRALARLAAVSVPLGAQVMRYLALFRPAKRQMSHARVVALLEEVLPDIERSAVTRRGRQWPAPRESWRVALETVLEARDKGSLTLPLKSHGYLYEILLGMADKQEAAAERERETSRQGGRAYSAGPTSVADAVAGALGTKDTSADVQAVQVPVPAYGTPPAPATSALVRKVKDEIARKKAARAASALDSVTQPTEGADDAR